MNRMKTLSSCRAPSLCANSPLCLRRSSRAPRTSCFLGPDDDRRRKLSIDRQKELSRKFRRTTFDFDDWAVHRSTERYWRHIRSGVLHSRIVRSLAAPLSYVAVLSVMVCCYETALLADALPDFGWQWPRISMNAGGPFSLSTFALSLLLVFRTNSSYQRWCEARKLWGLLINRSRDIARQATQWFTPSDAPLTAAACRWTIAFPLTLMASVRDDVQLQARLKDVLLPHELALVIAQPHPGSAVLQALGVVVRESQAKEVQKLRIDENITVLQDIMGGCERIFRTPIPLSYTRHTSRFLVCWLTCLPFCVADSMGWMTVPIAVGLAFFLLGIEEIGVQIEEPFGILSLEVFCATVTKNVRQAEAAAGLMQAAAKGLPGAVMAHSPTQRAGAAAASTNGSSRSSSSSGHAIGLIDGSHGMMLPTTAAAVSRDQQDEQFVAMAISSAITSDDSSDFSL